PPGRHEGHAHAVAGDRVPAFDEARRPHLQPFHRRVDVTHRPPDFALFAHDVPGFEGLTQLDLDTAEMDAAVCREAELEMRFEPVRLEIESESPHVADHVDEILPHEK